MPERVIVQTISPETNIPKEIGSTVLQLFITAHKVRCGHCLVNRRSIIIIQFSLEHDPHYLIERAI